MASIEEKMKFKQIVAVKGKLHALGTDGKVYLWRETDGWKELKQRVTIKYLTDEELKKMLDRIPTAELPKLMEEALEDDTVQEVIK